MHRADLACAVILEMLFELPCHGQFFWYILCRGFVQQLAQLALPRLLRAGYIDAPLIIDRDKEKLDQFLELIFDTQPDKSKKIQKAFTGQEQEFKEKLDGTQLHVKEKVIEITFIGQEEISIKCIYVHQNLVM